jgi:hypothetical protein
MNFEKGNLMNHLRPYLTILFLSLPDRKPCARAFTCEQLRYIVT